MIGLLAFAGGDVRAVHKDPETLMASAREWIDLAGQDFLEASMAAKRGDKRTAEEKLKAAEYKSARARYDIKEAIAVEAGPS